MTVIKLCLLYLMCASVLAMCYWHIQISGPVIVTSQTLGTSVSGGGGYQNNNMESAQKNEDTSVNLVRSGIYWYAIFVSLLTFSVLNITTHLIGKR